jgi:hypothetical protein
VRAAQHALAAIGHPAQLDARTELARRRGGSHRDQPPQQLAAACHGEARGARPAEHRVLAGVGNAAAAGGHTRGRRRAVLEAHHLARAEPDADDLMALPAGVGRSPTLTVRSTHPSGSSTPASGGIER